MLTKQTRNVAILSAVAAVSVSKLAYGVGWYYGGYDASVPIAGTPDLPVSGPFVVDGQVTFYSDAAGTIPNAAGTGFVTANNTSAELVFGGTTAATAYTASTPSSTGTPVIRSIILLANNPGTNTLNLGFTGGGRYTFASGGTGTVSTVGAGTPSIIGVGLYQGGSANWDFVNAGGSSAPLRAQNSFNISGPGSGNISIPFNIANVSGQPSLGVNLTGGATLTLGARNDFSGSGGTPNFTLTNGTVDFRNGRSFGQLNVQIRLNGGTLLSGNGSTIDGGYVGTGGTAGESPIRIGGNVTLAGTTAWGTGTVGVTINGNRTLTAGNTSTTGVTVGGVISDNGGTFGLTVAGSGTLTLTGANTYTGTTTVNSGKLVLGPASQSGVGGIDIKGGQAVLQYSGSSNIDTIRTALSNSFNDVATPGVIDTGSIRSGTATAVRGLGYKDDGVGAVTIRAALFGDADLDGGVSINDFNALAGNFGAGSGKYWVDGDFDYDGGVSINDFNLLAGGFGQSLPPTSEAWAGLLAFAAAHDDMAAFAAITGVPEPTSLGLIAAGATLSLRRRRR